MKIALCHHFSLTFFAGGEIALLNLAKVLIKRGHKVEIYALPIARREKRYSHLRQILEELDIIYTEGYFQRVRGVDIAYYVYAPLIHKMIKTDAPKIAGLHSPMYAIGIQHEDVKKLNLVSFTKRFGVVRALSRYYFELRRGELRAFDAVHIVNPAMRNYIPHTRIYFIPNGVDLSMFKPVSLDEKFEKFTVLYAGRREWAKGFDLFEKTAELLSNRNDIEFLTTGTGKTSSVSGKVRDLGFVAYDELPKIYSKSHVVLYPSRIDAHSLTIIEALTSGTPVITTPIPAHTVFELPLIYASTPSEMAKEILKLKEMYERRPDEYLKLVEQGLKAVKQYDISEVTKRFEEMFKEVLGNT